MDDTTSVAAVTAVTAATSSKSCILCVNYQSKRTCEVWRSFGRALGGLGQLWEALAELWEALGELWEGLYIQKLPINRPKRKLYNRLSNRIESNFTWPSL